MNGEALLEVLALQLPGELDDGEPQSPRAERPGDHRQERPQQLHVGLNGTCGGTVTPEINGGSLNEKARSRTAVYESGQPAHALAEIGLRAGKADPDGA